jgi:preprotein translocase subunit Sec63
MAGQKFEYDESGATFFYFILSFLALILVPATFYFWPKKKTEGKNAKVTVNVCHTCPSGFLINFMVVWIVTERFSPVLSL